MKTKKELEEEKQLSEEERKLLAKREAHMEFIMTYIIAFVALGIAVFGFIEGTIDPFLYIGLAAFMSTGRDILEFFKSGRK